MTPNDPQQLRAEIEATREELGETVQALAEKTDVSAQARRKLEETRATVHEKGEEVLHKVKHATPDSAAAAATQATAAASRNRVPLGLIGSFALGFLLGRLSAD